MARIGQERSLESVWWAARHAPKKRAAILFAIENQGELMGHDIAEALHYSFQLFGRWEGITAISTAAAAIFTAAMAYLTRKAIIEGQSQRKDTNDHFQLTREQDKRHHEDSFRPILVLVQTDISNAVNRGDIIKPNPIDINKGYVTIKCVVRNIGMGPSLRVRLHLRSDGRAGFGPTRELAPIAAGGEYGDSKDHLEIIAYYGDSFNRADLANVRNGLWILVLEYEDIFGNTFHTFHHKDQSKPWSIVDREPAPDS